VDRDSSAPVRRRCQIALPARRILSARPHCGASPTRSPTTRNSDGLRNGRWTVRRTLARDHPARSSRRDARRPAACAGV